MNMLSYHLKPPKLRFWFVLPGVYEAAADVLCANACVHLLALKI